MGIGLIALLTLFPIGALRMYLAIQSERCFQAGSNATAMATLKGLPNDKALANQGGTDPYQNPFNPKQAGVLDASPDGPSYPVFIDPVGYRTAFGTGSQSLVGGGAPGGPAYISRTSVSFVNNPPAGQTSTQAGYQWFTLLDDIDFESALPGQVVVQSQRVQPVIAVGDIQQAHLDFSAAFRGRLWTRAVVDPGARGGRRPDRGPGAEWARGRWQRRGRLWPGAEWARR